MSDHQPQLPAQPSHPDDQPPVPLDEARLVTWQTQPKEPMGQLPPSDLAEPYGLPLASSSGDAARS